MLILKNFTNVVLQIVPGHNNDVAIELISTHIRRKLQERSNQFRQKMAIPHRLSPSGSPHPDVGAEELGLTILPATNQLKVGVFVGFES